MTPFLKTIKYLSITFYLDLSFLCLRSREKNFINLNNLIAEIRKVKVIEKEIALVKSRKIIAFTKKWLIKSNIINSIA